MNYNVLQKKEKKRLANLLCSFISNDFICTAFKFFISFSQRIAKTMASVYKILTLFLIPG